jgi:hypothetical protein
VDSIVWEVREGLRTEERCSGLFSGSVGVERNQEGERIHRVVGLI